MSHVIFDFDGTLADTMPLVVRIVDGMQLRPQPLTPDEIAYFRTLSARHVIQESGVPLWKIPKLLLHGQSELKKVMHDATMFVGLQQTIRDLRADGHKLFVVSSNTSEIISEFLARYEVGNCFEQIYGDSTIFNKAKNIRKIVRDHTLDNAKTYYVGDEARDIEAARKSQVYSVAVNWGYNAEGILRSHKPDYFVDTPDDLMRIFK